MQKAITKENEKLINDLTEEIGVVYGTLQNSLLTKVNKALINSVPKSLDFKMFKEFYLAHQGELNQTLQAERDRFDKIIQNKVSEAERVIGFKLTVKLADGKQSNPTQATKVAVASAKSYAASSYKQVLKKDTTRTLKNVESYDIRKTTQEQLQEAVFQQTQKGIQQGLDVIYKNGARMSYRNYMEMNVRTTIQSELSATQIKAGQLNSVVFYMCNSFFDCANDHADYQGRMYYDEDWTSFDLDEQVKDKIQEFISSKQMMSVQQVRDDAPYLTTRPNCRHTLSPITIQEALNLTEDEIMDKLNLKEGKYDQDNYRASQHLRYAERNIREYKDRVAMNQELLKTAPAKMKDKIIERIMKDKKLVAKWQKEARTIANEYGIKRDYRRETSAVLIKDLGARYNKDNPEFIGKTILERQQEVASLIEQRQSIYGKYRNRRKISNHNNG